MRRDQVRHGNFVHSLVLTDIATGWTECVALLVREQTLIVQGFAKVRSDLPFAMRGLDTDNDSAFMNATVLGYCQGQGLELTRSRAYKKNDPAWVEQKNGARVAAGGGLWALERAPCYPRLGAAICCVAPVHPFLPALVQAETRRRAMVPGLPNAIMRP